jgi:hypothetical protein
MPNADITRLMNNARIKLPGALDSTIQLEMFGALDDFFQASNIWTEDIAFAVTPPSDTYTIYPGNDGIINRLMSLVNSDGVMQQATMYTPGEIRLQFAPSQADTFTARVAKTVTDPTDNENFPVFPDWVVGKYGNDILDGVLGRMMGQIAKPYSSPSLAVFHLRKFQQTINKARAEAMHGNVYRAQNWRFPQSYASARHRSF